VPLIAENEIVCTLCGHKFGIGEAIFNTPSRPRCFYCANIARGNKIYELASEIRCDNCNKLLATVENNSTKFPTDIVQEEVKTIDQDHTTVEIKCPRCKKLKQIIV
jgi:phage FluMu protein Com